MSEQSTIKEIIYNRILPRVSKPGRYIGNEINIIRKSLDEVDVRVALVFPDVYEVGMSYMGFPILYHILNQQPGVYAERAFAPWLDMEEVMREHNIPLFSLETFTPLADFDLIGFTLQYELHYTAILNLIDLSGLPVEAVKREKGPLILGGGPSAYNPEPLAEVLDAVIIGDGEEVSLEIVEAIRLARKENKSRLDTLEQLAMIEGVYVPRFYKPTYDTSSRFIGFTLQQNGVPERIRARMISTLESSAYPKKPLVPMIQTTHDRISLEIARGCSRGCRFCNAGMIYRPVRERSPQDLLEQAMENIDATGYEEISLVSLSTSDYSRFPELMRRLDATFTKDNISISFPSLRPESFTEEMAKFAKGVRKSGLTFAPEAGTQRLRDVINKATTEEQLLRAVDLAFREGWNLVKLYFMIGLPTENEEDLHGLVELLGKVLKVAGTYKGKRINVSVSPFIPKPITPFQWSDQDLPAEMQRKIDTLISKIPRKRIKLSWRKPEVALVEGALARGDRRVGAVIKTAWQLGSKLDGWSECFDFQCYAKAAQINGLELSQFTRGYDQNQPLPWDHIDKGVTKAFLQDEYKRAMGEEQLPDCRISSCNRCGLMGQRVCREIIRAVSKGEETQGVFDYNEVPVKKSGARENAVESQSKGRARLHYRRDSAVRFISHLDMLRLLERAMRRAKIPLVYTEGYNPHPKLSFGPSLATGLTSDAEYVDFVYYQPDYPVDFLKPISKQLPDGVECVELKTYRGKIPSLASVVNRADYFVRINRTSQLQDLQTRVSKLLSAPRLVIQRKKDKWIDVRPFIEHINVISEGFQLQSIMDNGKSIRIDELLELLFPDWKHPMAEVEVHRAALWIKQNDCLVHPMECVERSDYRNIERKNGKEYCHKCLTE